MNSKLSTGEKVCWFCVVLGTLMVAGPFLFPDSFKWNGGQYAMAMVGLLIALSSFISVFFFRTRRKGREELSGSDAKLLAKWTYSPGEWQAFIGEDFEREKALKWSLFKIVASLCLGIGALFFIFDPRGGGPWVFAVMLGIVLIIVVVILIGTRATKKARSGMAPEVRISENGLLLGKELHLWKGWRARLEGCTIEKGTPPVVEFIYSTPAKNQRQINSVRVPAPQGRDMEVVELVAHFQTLIEKS